MAPVRPEPGFDPALYVDHDNTRTAFWIVLSLTVVVLFTLGVLWWFDRPSVSEMRGTIQPHASWLDEPLRVERTMSARLEATEDRP